MRRCKTPWTKKRCGGELLIIKELRKELKIPKKISIDWKVDSFWKGNCHHVIIDIQNAQTLSDKGYAVPSRKETIECFLPLGKMVKKS